MKHPGWTMSGWVVTHRENHDDPESAERAIADHASNATVAWEKFLVLVCNERSWTTKKQWNARGYIARRVTITVEIHD